MSFQWSAFTGVLPLLLRAAMLNLELAAVIMVLAVAGSTGLTVLRSLKVSPVNTAVDLVISFVRGTPLLIQIFVCFYGLPAIGLNLSPIAAGVLAIAANSTVFLGEAMRAGLGTINPGQIEAATALALRAPVIWLRVVLPQLFRQILPILTAELTIIVKGTALLSVITVVEVLRTAQQVGSATYRPFEVILAAGLVFLCINLVIGTAGRIAEARLAVGRG